MAASLLRPTRYAAALSALALLGGWAPKARAGSATTADIVLSVGTTSGGKECSLESETSCELVRVKVDLSGAPRATSVTTLVPRSGAAGADTSPVEPAVSPDGSRLAWIERNKASAQLWVRNFEDGKNLLIAKSGAPRNGGIGKRPEWPAWLGRDTLLFDAKTEEHNGVENKTIFSVDVSSLAKPGKPVKRLGAGMGRDGGLQDPAVRWTGDGAEVVSFGPTRADSEDLYQMQLRTLDREGRALPGSLDLPRGTNAAGKELTACHHPSWNRSGNSILCQSHKPSERIDGLDTKLLYRYTRNGSGDWSAAGRAFEPLSPKAAGLEAASLLDDSAGCVGLIYKFAEYCRSDDWILTTLHCTEGSSGTGRGAKVGASRLLLVHTDPVQYIDVTRLIEKERDLPVGGLSAFSGTCRALE